MTTTGIDTAARRRPLAIGDVTVSDGFWAPRREVVRTKTIPQQERQLRAAGQQFDALRLQRWEGDGDEPHIFWESDVAKWIEAASYTLARQYDPALDASVDEAIALLAGAQQDDGYLNVVFSVVRPGERFTDLQDAHELYNAGHLIEAGVAHHAATGKSTLLDIVRRYADLIDVEFGPGGSAEGGYDGHQEIELALVRLARATGEEKYLRLAERLLDNRGQQPFYFDAERQRRGKAGYWDHVFEDRERRVDWYRMYNQSHLPVREQTEVVGHSVRAMYMYSAMADVALLSGDDSLREACERLWNDLVDTKLYVTGGIGALHDIEGFGPAYYLPDAEGYAETCAAIGLIFWAQRMALLTGEAKYIDVLERSLYNGALSGASDDGTCYFYGNPLASDGTVERSEWFGVACCPPNFARLMSSLEYYVYAVDDEGLTVNLYVAGEARIDHHGTPVTFTQQGGFPWDGHVEMTIALAEPTRLTVRLRIPDWASGHAVTLNGAPLGGELGGELVNGYVVVDREWTDGDVIVLDLDMTPARLWANQRVAASLGKVAFQRGPVVHCVEEVDNAAPVPALAAARDGAIEVRHDEASDLDYLLVDGVVETAASAALYTATAPRDERAQVRTTPYFHWANRGRGTMAVWIREAASRG